jgi:hypothetical protein
MTATGDGDRTKRGAEPTVTTDETPDERLAERIVRRLVAEGLVAAAEAGALRRAVAAGQVNKAAWRELAEADGGVPGGEALSFDAVLGGEGLA